MGNSGNNNTSPANKRDSSVLDEINDLLVILEAAQDRLDAARFSMACVYLDHAIALLRDERAKEKIDDSH